MQETVAAGTTTADATETKTGAAETPSRAPPETRKAIKSPDTTKGELQALRMLYGWREAAIRAFAPPREREALLAALRDERRAAERALRAKKRRQREDERNTGQRTRPRRPWRKEKRLEPTKTPAAPNGS